MNSILSVDMAAGVNDSCRSARNGNLRSEDGFCEDDQRYDISAEEKFYSSPAIRLAAEHSFSMSDISIDEIEYFDIYSCFPSAVRVAADELGLDVNDPRGLTLTGGLTQFESEITIPPILLLPFLTRSLKVLLDMLLRRMVVLTKHAVGIY